MNPSEHLDATFTALADPTRRAILARLMEGDATVNELASPFDISQPAVSKHLKILERAGLVSRSNVGTTRPVRIEAAPMREAADWLEKYRDFWQKSYQRLDTLLEILQTPLNGDKPRKPRKDDDA
jgi:DNA-binding transcriptional ArsR family regulator